MLRRNSFLWDRKIRSIRRNLRSRLPHIQIAKRDPILKSLSARLLLIQSLSLQSLIKSNQGPCIRTQMPRTLRTSKLLLLPWVLIKKTAKIKVTQECQYYPKRVMNSVLAKLFLLSNCRAHLLEEVITQQDRCLLWDKDYQKDTTILIWENQVMESSLISTPVTIKDLRLCCLIHQLRQHTSKLSTYLLIRLPQCWPTQVVALLTRIISTEDLNLGREEEIRMSQHLLTV